MLLFWNYIHIYFFSVFIVETCIVFPSVINGSMNMAIYIHKLGLWLPGTVQNIVQSVTENSNSGGKSHVQVRPNHISLLRMKCTENGMNQVQAI
jgi:hypothetical protein